MAEYWKPTPKYLCKYCDVYVRDTKLERTNHEATGRHQGAVKRFLRGLHRTAADEDREKERARREIDRLNGVDRPSLAAAPLTAGRQQPHHQPQQAQQARGAYAEPIAPSATATAAEHRARMEQLAELGVAIPSEFRGDMALAGEWSTTSERVIRRRVDAEGQVIGGDDGDGDKETQKKRGPTEQEQEEEDAVRGLFKRAKTGKWGRDSRRVGNAEDEADLDALLGAVVTGRREAEVKEEEESKPDVKREDGVKLDKDPKLADSAKAEGIKSEEGARLESDGDRKDTAPPRPDLKPKPEPDSEDTKVALGDIPTQAAEEPLGGTGDAAPAVLFKKRKAKNLRQK